MTTAWIAVGVFVGVGLVVTAGLVAAGRVLGVRARVVAPLQADTYECGEPPAGGAWLQFNSRYFVVALVFVIFDVEAALLFPWALQARALGLPVVIPGLIFIGILMLGWLYAVKKGALQWR